MHRECGCPAAGAAPPVPTPREGDCSLRRRQAIFVRSALGLVCFKGMLSRTQLCERAVSIQKRRSRVGNNSTARRVSLSTRKREPSASECRPPSIARDVRQTSRVADNFNHPSSRRTETNYRYCEAGSGPERIAFRIEAGLSFVSRARNAHDLILARFARYGTLV